MSLVEEILQYWFGSETGDAQVLAQQGKLWFGKDAAVDAEIERRFGELVVAVGEQGGMLFDEAAQERRMLASILLLDQFTRNIYRGDPRCFASDQKALRLALAMLDAGLEQRLRPIERVFVYLPLEHSEDLDLQNRSVELFRGLLAEVGEDCRAGFSSFLDYAIRHQQIIERFGRFPHRNRILGRASTPAEEAFLQQPNSSF